MTLHRSSQIWTPTSQRCVQSTEVRERYSIQTNVCICRAHPVAMWLHKNSAPCLEKDREPQPACMVLCILETQMLVFLAAWANPCRDVSNLVIGGQGPPPPNPAVVERFQQVISQLFQQVEFPHMIALKDAHKNFCSAKKMSMPNRC